MKKKQTAPRRKAERKLLIGERGDIRVGIMNGYWIASVINEVGLLGVQGNGLTRVKALCDLQARIRDEIKVLLAARGVVGLLVKEEFLHEFPED